VILMGYLVLEKMLHLGLHFCGLVSVEMQNGEITQLVLAVVFLVLLFIVVLVDSW
jgi:hypothetical protein